MQLMQLEINMVSKGINYMKRSKIENKKRIEKRHEKLVFLDENIFSMNIDRDKRRLYSDNPTPLNTVGLTRNERRTGILLDKTPIVLRTFIKKNVVDYDVVICIPSHNRFDKVRRLINQFKDQETKYTFKIILLNDGSSDDSYNKLMNEFNDITYLVNEKPNGKILHWYCYNQMWEHLKDIQCHAILQMDDDFILSNNFLNTIVDLFFEMKEKNGNFMAISPHLWSFKINTEYEDWWKRTNFIDGIGLIDEEVIKYMNYEMQPVDAEAVQKVGAPVRAWTQIGAVIQKMGGMIYRTANSLVYHDGNDDSKLHGDIRINGKAGVYTQKYVGEL